MRLKIIKMATRNRLTYLKSKPDFESSNANFDLDLNVNYDVSYLRNDLIIKEAVYGTK
jgi:hypothetical protein